MTASLKKRRVKGYAWVGLDGDLCEDCWRINRAPRSVGDLVDIGEDNYYPGDTFGIVAIPNCCFLAQVVES